MKVLGWVLAVLFGMTTLGALAEAEFGGALVSGAIAGLGVWLIRRPAQGATPAQGQPAARQDGAHTAAPSPPSSQTYDRYKLSPADEYTKDGQHERLRGRGFHIHTLNEGLGISWKGLTLQDDGLVVTTIAGAQHHKMLQSPVVEPGRPLRLVRDPKNEHDPNAVQVHAISQAADTQVGWVPRDDAPMVASIMDRGQELHAGVLWEWIGEDGKRASLVMVISRPGLVKGI